MRPLSRALKAVAAFVATLAIGGLVGNAPGFAEPQETATGSSSTSLPTPIPLRLQETTQMDWTAPNASRDGTKCDADGNVFIHFGNYDFVRQHFQEDSAISEVVPDSKRIVEHAIPPLSASDYPNPQVMSFTVSVDGVVYTLIATRRNASDGEPRPATEYYVEQLEEGIASDSPTHLQAPPGAAHWSAYLLGAFPNGNFLTAGERSDDAGRPSPGSYRPFTAIYDSSGRLLVEVMLPGDVVNNYSKYAGSPSGAATAGTPPAKSAEAVPTDASDHTGALAQSKESPKPREYLETSIISGGIVSGPDGNVWILRDSDPIRLYAVDAAGQVARHFQFSPPVAGLTPTQFGFAGPGQIFFDFIHVATGPGRYSGPWEIIGVFDVASGQFNALYTLPSAGSGAGFFGCADGRGGFIYLGHSTDHHLALLDYR